jgi:CubicO group peptidase (beta-lactamase class C family)
VTAATLFQAGSISKPIFALAVMRLAEQSSLDLDEDVNRYLASWKVPPNGSWQPRVTLRQILSHSAGFTVHGFPGYGAEGVVASVVHVLNGEPPANTPPVRVNILPGVQFRYSGGGITVGQLFVSDLLGKPFPSLMRELVLDLGMATAPMSAAPGPGRAPPPRTCEGLLLRPLHVYPEMAAGLRTTARQREASAFSA